MLANVAELGAERMEETIGKASLRDAAIGTGIAVDKMLALTGQTPAVQIANIVLPTEEEREERRALHDKLGRDATPCSGTAPEARPNKRECRSCAPSAFSAVFYFSSSG